MDPAMSSEPVGMSRKTTRRYRYDYPAVAPSVAGMTPEQPAQPGPRLAYDDAATPQQMSADCRAAGDHLRLGQAAEAAVSGRPPALHFDDYPREITKRDIRVSEATARIANALHLHLD